MQKYYTATILILLGSLLMSACGPSEAELTPTVDVPQVQTQAVETFAAALTATALANPTATPTPQPSATPFATLALGTPIGTSATLAGGTSTCNRLVYVRDVTIPDNTPMTPGQAFTKTWEVQNTGTCPWDAGFKFTLIGGDAMGGQTLTLSQAVAPNGSTQLSVPMTAPTNKSGVIQGSWRMSTAAGVYFGDGLTVVIVIGGATAAATNTGGPSATPSLTSTP
jgi:hypothetical protein